MTDLPGRLDVVKVHIDIDREAPIVNLPPYRVPTTMSSSVKSELDTLLEQGIIESSNSLWSSPIIPVIKPNGKIRVCMDFRRLNSITPQSHYPRKHGMMAKPDKFSWAKKFLEYLEHRIGNDSLAVPEHRIEAMRSFKRPNTTKQLKSFIGSISYYRRFTLG